MRGENTTKNDLKWMWRKSDVIKGYQLLFKIKKQTQLTHFNNFSPSIIK